jgi:hypothetical protein
MNAPYRAMPRWAGIRADVTPVCCRQRRPRRGSKIMSIKRILVPLPGSVGHTAEIDMALSAAKTLGAHVEALFISQPTPVAHRSNAMTECRTIRFISIPQQIARCSVPRKGLGHLAAKPDLRGIWGDFEVNNPSAIVAEHNQGIKQLEDAGMAGAISFTPQVRRVACSARPWPSSPTPCARAYWPARWRRPWSVAWPTMR